MKGIFGILHTGDRPVSEKHLAQMDKGVSFDSSYSNKIWCSGRIGMGVSAAPETAGPHLNGCSFNGGTDRLIIAADTRLNNRSSLLQTLGLPTCSEAGVKDEDIIGRAYRQWGKTFPARLSGEFALAIWDPGNQRLLCAKDHIGKRPLFYYHDHKTFLFASQIKAIRDLEMVAAELNELMLAAALWLVETDRSHTFFKGIRRFKAGHILEVQGGSRFSTVETRYWQPLLKGHSQIMPDRWYTETLHDKIQSSVLRELDTPGPYGSMLSGGLDSSAVSCIAARELRKRQQPLLTVSSVLDESHRGIEQDERRYISEISAQAPNIIPTFVTAPEADPFQNLESKFDRFSTPVNAFHYMDEAIARAFYKNCIKLVFSGFLGDTFVSYKGRDSLARILLRFRLRTALGIMKEFEKSGRGTLGSQIRTQILPWLFPRKPAIPGLFKKRGANQTPPSPASPIFQKKFSGCGRRKKRLLLEQALFNTAWGSPAIEYKEADYARLGMKVCFPLWNKEIVEFIISTPPEQFVAGGTDRSLFRRAMKGILPEPVRTRTTKTPYTPDFHQRIMNVEKYIRRQLDEVESDSGLNDYISYYVDTDLIRKKLNTIQPAAGPGDWGKEAQGIVANGIILIRFLTWIKGL